MDLLKAKNTLIPPFRTNSFFSKFVFLFECTEETMYHKLLFVIFIFLLGISSLSGQSNYEPEGGETALDTARGRERMQLLIRLIHKYHETNSERAIELLEEAFAYQKEAYDDTDEYLKQRLALLGWSSMPYFYANQKEKALENLDKAFALTDSVCQPEIPCHERAMLYAFLATHNNRDGNPAAALKSHKKALPIFRAVGDFHNEALAYNNISIVFTNLEQRDSAIFYMDKSIEAHLKIGTPTNVMAQLRYNYAVLHGETGNNERSIQMFYDVLDTCLIHNLELLPLVQLDFAGEKNKENQFEESWKLLKDCREDILQSSSLKRVLKWYRFAAKATKELSMLDSSLVYSEKYIVLEDSLSNLENKEKISQLEESVKVKSKEFEIDSLSHRLQNQKRNLFFLFSLLLGALGLAFYYFRKSKKVRKQNTLKIRYFLSGKSEIDSPPDIDPFLENVLQIINENIEDPSFNVEALAAKAFTSRSNLFKKIKPLSGKSPVVLIREVRMEKAKLLLDTNKFSVKEIAQKVGYEDSSYFTRVFKKYFGETPSKRA